MIKRRMIHNGFRVAWSHKMRALFMMMSVFVGIAALTVIISLGQGTEKKITSQVQKLLSANTIMVISGNGKIEPNKTLSRTGTIKKEEVEEVIQQVPNIDRYDMVQRLTGKTAEANGNGSTVDVLGQLPSAEYVWNLSMTQGRFYSEEENRSLARVAVIGPHVRKALFADTDPVGQLIKIDNIPFQVIGVLGERGMDPHGIDKDNEIIIPLNTVMRRVSNDNYVLFVKFLVNNRNELSSTADLIAQSLRQAHSLQAQEQNDFIVVTPARAQEIISSATRMFNLYLPLLAAVSLFVGGIVIINLMLISVNERKKEIGLRKAVGARSSDITIQFLIESSSITVVSGLLGIGVGAIIFSYLAQRLSIPPVISWDSILLCSAASLIVGILAGYWPAKKAAALTPIETLR
jgi:putative ABC transport system permease protein